jgi:four helix bundle protein
MPHTPRDLQARTRAFALRILRVFRSLPESREARVLGPQLLRSATSVAANYRAACRARSRRDFLSKLGIVEEEADESLFWLEFIADAGLIQREKLSDLIPEAGQLTAIVVASRRTAKANIRKSAIENRKSS